MTDDWATFDDFQGASSGTFEANFEEESVKQEVPSQHKEPEKHKEGKVVVSVYDPKRILLQRTAYTIILQIPFCCCCITFNHAYNTASF
jgi:hypothetical protein